MIQAIRHLLPRHWLLLILLLKLVLGSLYITQQPLWQYHEADFLRVVRYLRDEGKLPVLAEDASPDTRNNSQPPLYYLMLLPVVSALDSHLTVPAGLNPTAVCDGYNTNLTSLLTTAADDRPLEGTIALGYSLRFLSLAMSVVGVVFTYLAGRTLFPQKPVIGVVGAALMAFEPTSVLVASQINNDTLIFAWGAVHLWFCARLIRRQGSLAVNLAGLLGIAVLAILTKLSGWLMLAISLALIGGVLVTLTRQRATYRQKRVVLGASAVLLIAVTGIAVFNLAQYGSLFGRYRGLDTTIQNTLRNLPPQHILLMTAATLQDTMADYLSPLRQLQPPTLVLIGDIALLGLAGLAGLYAIGKALYRRDKAALTALALLVVYALLMVALVIFRAILNNGNPDFINSMIIISPVRYYAPALPALALTSAAGFAVVTVPRLRGIGVMSGAAVAVCWLLIACGSVAQLVNLNRMRDEAILSAEAYAARQGIIPVTLPQEAGLPQVLGYQMTPDAAGGLVKLDLYVRTDQALSENYALQTTLTGGGLSSTCLSSPVRGLLPSLRWPPQQVIVLHVEIPNCIAQREPPFALEAQWMQATTRDGVATTQAVGAAVTLGEVGDKLAVAGACPANRGVIGSGLQLLRYNAPGSITLQNQPAYFVPSVNWLAREIPPEAYLRFYVLQHTGSTTAYQCGGLPRQDTYPFSRWSAGETIYFDECVMTLPVDTPKGDYVVSVGVQDREGRWLTAVDANGITQATGVIAVGNLTIK